jgi:hypothetical protein
MVYFVSIGGAALSALNAPSTASQELASTEA